MGNIFKKIEGNLKKITSIYATKKGAGGSSDPRSVLAGTTALDGCIATYRRNLDAYYKYYGFNEAEGWGYKIEKSDGEVGEGSAGGVLGTGTGKYLAATSHTVPSALYNGGQGNVLTFLSCWLCGGFYYYQKPFKFTKGHHTVTFNLYIDKVSYNVNTSYTGLTDDVNNFNIKYRLGIGSLYNSTNGYKQCVLEFVVTEDEEELYLCFGYRSQNYGSGSMPMIALDSVEGLPGEGANELVNICKVYNGSRLIKDFCGGNDDGGGDDGGDDTPTDYTGENIKNHPYYNDYFTLEAIDGFQLPMNTNDSLKNIQYSVNGGDWKSGEILFLNPGDKVRMKCTKTNSYSQTDNLFDLINEHYKVYGNINSLCAGDDFTTDMTVRNSKFSYLFNNCKGLVDASNLVLPFTTLGDGMYFAMFANCTSLEKIPVLPATTLAGNCYYQLFYNCTSLNEVPKLSATTLASSCYDSMFRECTSLTETPELPALEMVKNCYSSMFYGCTSLEKAPVLPAKKLVNYCYQTMFAQCTKLNYIKCLAEEGLKEYSVYNTMYWVQGVPTTGGTFVKKKGVAWDSNASSIPSGWTVEEVD